MELLARSRVPSSFREGKIHFSLCAAPLINILSGFSHPIKREVRKWRRIDPPQQQTSPISFINISSAPESCLRKDNARTSARKVCERLGLDSALARHRGISFHMEISAAIKFEFMSAICARALIFAENRRAPTACRN